MPPRTVKPKLDDAPAALARTDATSAMNLRVLRKEDDAIERIVEGVDVGAWLASRT